MKNLNYLSANNSEVSASESGGETDATELPQKVAPTEKEEPVPEEAGKAEQEEKRPEEKPEEAPEEKIEFTSERDYIVPLSSVYWLGRSKRAKRAVNVLRRFVVKHMKAEDVYIDQEVNEAIWSRSIEKPPRKIAIHVGITKEKKAYVYPGKLHSESTA